MKIHDVKTSSSLVLVVAAFLVMSMVSEGNAAEPKGNYLFDRRNLAYSEKSEYGREVTQQVYTFGSRESYEETSVEKVQESVNKYLDNLKDRGTPDPPYEGPKVTFTVTIKPVVVYWNAWVPALGETFVKDYKEYKDYLILRLILTDELAVGLSYTIGIPYVHVFAGYQDARVIP